MKTAERRAILNGSINPKTPTIAREKTKAKSDIDWQMEFENREAWTSAPPHFADVQTIPMDLTFDRTTWFLLLEAASKNGTTPARIIRYFVQRHIMEESHEFDLAWGQASMEQPAPNKAN